MKPDFYSPFASEPIVASKYLLHCCHHRVSVGADLRISMISGAVLKWILFTG
jgi:hypothetical protein